MTTPHPSSATLDIYEELSYQLIVVGGGLAGICAAIAAARAGVQVALIQDRPVLGGNSSSEIRVHPVGASQHGYRRDARETGIIEEILLDVRARAYGLRQVNGADYPLWDLTLLEKVEAEPNIALYLNTRVCGVEMDSSDPLRVAAVLALQLSTERAYRLRCELLLDASGDGVAALLAGAAHRYGREARAEFGEPRAPEQADDIVLGSTMMFAARDVGRPVPFVAPAWAHRFHSEESLPFRNHDQFESGYWWIEWGGRLHTIADNEAIRKELTAAILGVWDHIKNHCTLPGVRDRAATYALEWVGQVPGKRESRRFEGDHILTEHDIMECRLPYDTVAYGGWPIDLHPPDGIYASEKPAHNPPLPGIYGIPLRALYSRTVANLMLAGRDISATHIAHGSLRVMKTCAVIGEAAGTAAAQAIRRGVAPRALAHTPELLHPLQQTLLRNGCYLPGVRNADPEDLARQPGVTVRASSTASLQLDDDDQRNRFAWEYAGMSGTELPSRLAAEYPLSHRLAQAWVTSAPTLDQVALQLRSQRSTVTAVRLTIRSAEHLRDFGTSDSPVLATATAMLAPGTHALRFRFDRPIPVPPGRPLILLPEALDDLFWCLSAQEPPGTQAASWDADLGYWRLLHGTFRANTDPVSCPYGPEQVLTGVSRPDQATNMWISDPAQPPGPGQPAWIELTWPHPVTIGRVELTFDSDLSGWIWEGAFPTLVRDYTLAVDTHGEWRSVATVSGNHQRRRVHTFAPLRTSLLRLSISATNGIATARVCEVRAYAE